MTLPEVKSGPSLFLVLVGGIAVLGVVLALGLGAMTAVISGFGAVVLAVVALVIGRRASRIQTGTGDDGKKIYTRIGRASLARYVWAQRMRGLPVGRWTVILAATSVVSALTPWRAALGDVGAAVAGASSVQGLAAGVALVIMSAAGGRRYRRQVTAHIAERARYAETVRYICGVGETAWDSAVWDLDRATRSIVIRAPHEAVAGAMRGADRVTQALPGWTLDVERSGSVAVLRERTADERRRAQLMVDSDGLVLDIAETSEGRYELTLAPGISPTRAEHVETWAQRTAGLSLVEWAPVQRRAVAARLTDEESYYRSRFAAQMGAFAHELSVHVDATQDGGRRLSLESEHLRRASAARRRTTAEELVTSLGDPADGRQWHIQVDDRTGIVTLAERVDPLGKGFDIDGFAKRFPIQGDPTESFKAFPIAIQEDDSPVIYTTFQTLVVGQTGSGKGSVLWSIIRGFVPAMRAGVAKVYGIDPKGAEFIAPSGGPNAVFEEIATEPDQWAELVMKVGALMDARKGMGRSLAATSETPVVILAIDEFAAVGQLDGDRKRAAAVQQELTRVASQGRSLLVFIVGAVQEPTLDAVGRFRNFAGLKIALRTATPTHTDIVLGEGSEAGGAPASRIAVATPANGYRTAGIGYMRLEGYPTPQRIRFPRVPDEWIEELHQEFMTRRPAPSTNSPSSDDDLFA